jgi:hypothetical protein
MLKYKVEFDDDDIRSAWGEDGFGGRFVGRVFVFTDSTMLNHFADSKKSTKFQ